MATTYTKQNIPSTSYTKVTLPVVKYNKTGNSYLANGSGAILTSKGDRIVFSMSTGYTKISYP